jgi:hypothetical protein
LLVAVKEASKYSTGRDTPIARLKALHAEAIELEKHFYTNVALAKAITKAERALQRMGAFEL